MAFISPATTLGSRLAPTRLSQPPHSRTRRPTPSQPPFATAVQPNRPPQTASKPGRPKRNPVPRAASVSSASSASSSAAAAAARSRTPAARSRTPAVTDSRVASRHEVHHWVTVKGSTRRLFERAAAAQADVAHRLEQSLPSSGALHRWVLRECTELFLNDDGASPAALPVEDAQQGALPDVFARQRSARYVVMESFAREQTAPAESGGVSASQTRRWLSAVERVAPVMCAVDMHSLHYRDVFTTKVHDVVFDPRHNVVVLESINVRAEVHESASRQRTLANVVDALRAKAERSVAVGHCLEFCVLQSVSKPGLFKTVAVYTDATMLQEHMLGIDKRFMRSLQPHVMDARRTRHIFKPVVFA